MFLFLSCQSIDDYVFGGSHAIDLFIVISKNLTPLLARACYSMKHLICRKCLDDYMNEIANNNIILLVISLTNLYL